MRRRPTPIQVALVALLLAHAAVLAARHLVRPARPAADVGVEERSHALLATLADRCAALEAEIAGIGAPARLVPASADGTTGRRQVVDAANAIEQEIVRRAAALERSFVSFGFLAWWHWAFASIGTPVPIGPPPSRLEHLDVAIDLTCIATLALREPTYARYERLRAGLHAVLEESPSTAFHVWALGTSGLLGPRVTMRSGVLIERRDNLSHFGEPRIPLALAPTVAGLARKYPEHAIAVHHGLAGIPHREIAAAFVEALGDPRVDVRRSAAGHLSDLPPSLLVEIRQDVEALRRRETDSAVARALAKALARAQ
jgi:hypothetical protein